MYNIPKAEVLRYLGYNGQELPGELEDKIVYLTERARKVCSPREVHMVSDVLRENDVISLSGTNICLSSGSIREYLRGAEKCITLACTLGTGFEAELLRLQKTGMTDAVIFDAIGNAFIEDYADSVENALLIPYKNDRLYGKCRFSPGYGDLPLNLQRVILASLSAEKKIGLTATDTDILIPRKSITAFIGIFNEPQNNPNSKCEGCSLNRFCKMRRDGMSCD